MKSFLSIKIVFLFFFVVLTNTTKAQPACSTNGIVQSCSSEPCNYFTGNGYTTYMFMHEDGTPGTTFKTNETIYHYAPNTASLCLSPTNPTAVYRTINLPTGATVLCGPTFMQYYLFCDPGFPMINKTCQKVGPVQYVFMKVTQFKFAMAGTYDCTFNNGDGRTVTLTIDDNAVTTTTPYASIASDKGTTIAPNTSVTFTLSTNFTIPPDLPTATNHNVVWKKNGTTVQTGGTTYTTSTLANNDKITCQVAFTCGGDRAKSPTSSNTLTMTVTSALPVELKSFDGKALKAGNLLTWNTATEINNKGFALERQVSNSKEWEDIMLFVGKNKSATYEYLDETTDKVSYYRLRQIDKDGSTAYSKIIAVERTGNLKGFGLSVYPNPVSEVLNFEADDTNVNYQIINLLGQTVLRGVASTQINVSALPQGTYFLKVGTEQVKFIKQ